MTPFQKRDIDAVVLAGKDVYLAGKTYGLVPAAAEHYAGKNTQELCALAILQLFGDSAPTRKWKCCRKSWTEAILLGPFRRPTGKAALRR